MQYFQSLFDLFLSLFPQNLQWLVALTVLGVTIMSLVLFFKKHWVFLIVFIVLTPFSLPALNKIFVVISQAFLYVWGKTGF